MTHLSEIREETDEPDIKKKSRAGFQAGFLTGAFTVLVCTMILAAVSGLFRRQRQGEEQSGAEVLTSQETADKLEEIQKLIQRKALGEIDGQELSDYLFRGVAAGLDDAYARYYTSDELTSVRESNDGAYYGIGATLSQDVNTGEIRVSTVYEDSPAALAGLQEEDQLLRLEDTSLTGMDLSDVITLIREYEGIFHLTVLRDDQEAELEMACGQVEKKTVKYEITGDDIGYIRITEFDSVTVVQFQDAVDDLMGQGVQGLIFDLRDNPGGLLTAVCDIVDYLLPEGLIVYTEDRNGVGEEYKSDDEHYVNCPMAVLVNGNSASGSEIFAGALQDHEAAVIIGTTTYGKGVVQNTYELSDGSALKLTVEKYYTPNGQDIDGNGITPDYVVEEGDSQEEDLPLNKALEVLKNEGAEDNFSGAAD
ncbi:MAG: S41 family peptidase [Lachnospiraceae bacterium]|nr:S41 family peptidase [Lachnospiraceae bacterium]